jgi:hypothetical protein
VKFFRAASAAIVVLLISAAGQALGMSVLAPSFPELVAESATIVRARVAEVVTRKVTNAHGEVIKTFVTFNVSSALKGAGSDKSVTLPFLGGTVGDETLAIAGMPTFEVGAEEFLFVSAQAGVCPLVGAMHGRYHVLTNQKLDRPYVARDDGSPLVRVADVALPMGTNRTATALSGGDQALTPDAFEQLVLDEVAHPRSVTSTR